MHKASDAYYEKIIEITTLEKLIEFIKSVHNDVVIDGDGLSITIYDDWRD